MTDELREIFLEEVENYAINRYFNWLLSGEQAAALDSRRTK
jgi:hypothetical protein